MRPPQVKGVNFRAEGSSIDKVRIQLSFLDLGYGESGFASPIVNSSFVPGNRLILAVAF
jgi:hypothetical protein